MRQKWQTRWVATGADLRGLLMELRKLGVQWESRKVNRGNKQYEGHGWVVRWCKKA